MDGIAEPTGEQCEAHALVYESESCMGYAMWYPQMGGYSGKAVAIMDKRWRETKDGQASVGGCIEVLVWHDGQFPFSNDDDLDPKVVQLHHCGAKQFVEFGETLHRLNEANKTVVERL